MNRIILGLMMLCLGLSAFGMKRTYEEMEEPEVQQLVESSPAAPMEIEEELSASVPVRIPAPVVAPILVEEGRELSPLESLPEEMKLHIFDYLITAKGATNTAKLYNAANNIRSFLMINR